MRCIAVAVSATEQVYLTSGILASLFLALLFVSTAVLVTQPYFALKTLMET